MQDYVQAADMYERLSQLYPKTAQYRLYYAQSLLNACFYDEAMRVALLLESNHNDLDSVLKYGCICYKVSPMLQSQDGRYHDSLKYFEKAVSINGSTPELLYNMAVCHYKLQQYAMALRHVGEIVEMGIRDHPGLILQKIVELGIGSSSDGIDMQSVGNSLILYDSAIVEAFNLKAAIEYQLSNIQAAKEAISDIPPRLEEELDPVTLHNTALVNMDTQANQGFEKFQYLLQQPTWPEHTFSNILILYLKYGVCKFGSLLALRRGCRRDGGQRLLCRTLFEHSMDVLVTPTVDISAIILANLCVSYIMINRNEEAEEIMRKIEKDELQDFVNVYKIYKTLLECAESFLAEHDQCRLEDLMPPETAGQIPHLEESCDVADESIFNLESKSSFPKIEKVVEQIKTSCHQNFAIQVDESTDVANCAQLIIFARYVYDGDFKEEFLFSYSLESTTKGEDIFQAISMFFDSVGLSWNNVCCCTTDGAPAMLGFHSGFRDQVRLANQETKHMHCMLHRYALAAKTLPSDLRYVLDDVVHIIIILKRVL
ncbi:tetratricopeptide repeat protein 30A-like [Octopus sinensis]|uniref:Tetratricopeptide repeat protein 30 n=1 Tax=Octopus sinensis TaxID=2607531 RepID=A0A6P7TZB0_9MOLL|nr:tetratricopeptide repeat protein 30A-like [Octopus sinensis]